MTNLNLVPTSLVVGGRVFMKAGPGRTPGGLAFFDAAGERVVEFYVAEVTVLGPTTTKVDVKANAALHDVVIPNKAISAPAGLKLRDVLLVGPVHWSNGTSPAEPFAEAGWFLRAGAPATPAGRLVGVVVRVAPTGTWGVISDQATGRHFFLHISQVMGGALALGRRVTFVASSNEHGLAAYDVRTATA